MKKKLKKPAEAVKEVIPASDPEQDQHDDPQDDPSDFSKENDISPDPGALSGITKPRSTESDFASYISKVKKQIAPDLRINRTAMNVLNSFIDDFFNRICQESSKMMEVAGHKVLRTEDVLSAIKIVLPKELAHHTVIHVKTSIEKLDFAKKINLT